MRLILKYVQKRANGAFRYRRAVPRQLRESLGKGEIVQALGNSQNEMLRAYPLVHAAAQRQLANATRATNHSTEVSYALGTPMEAHQRLLGRLRGHGLALSLEGLGGIPEDNFVPDELEHRHYLADGILDGYPRHPETGDPVGVTTDDAAMVRALYSGAPAAPSPTLSDALKLYIANKLAPQDIKQRQRVERVLRYANTALGGDVRLTDIRRAGAVKVRAYLLTRPCNTPSTAKRNLAGIKAVLAYANWYHQLGLEDLFKGVAVKVLGQQRDQRRSLTENEVAAIGLRLSSKTNRGPELRLIWTLLEFTGCRLAEISGIEKTDIVLDGDPIPHLALRHRESRRLKNDASERDLPLVPAAVEALREALSVSGKGLHLFPRYAAKADNLSAALMRHVRAVTLDPKATVHSLRHLLKDRMALAGVAFEVQEMVLGHRIPGEAGTYGSAHLRQMAGGLAQTFPLPMEVEVVVPAPDQPPALKAR